MMMYDSYKDSGIEWIGDVPVHWSILRIKDIFSLERGKFTHRPRNDERMYNDGKFPFIQTGDVANSSKYIINYKQVLNENGIKVSRKFKKGTLLMTIAANIGDVAILGFDAYFPDSIVAFKTKYNTDYYFYLLSITKSELNTVKITNTQDNLNLERLNGLRKLCPPLLEQTAIASYLDTKTQAIDKKVSLLEKKIGYYQALRKNLIYETVTKGLDKNVKLKDSGIDWIGQIPEHWVVKRIKDIFSTLAGGTPSTQNKEYWTGTIPWIPSGKVQNNNVLIESVEEYISDLALKESSAKIAKKDSVLIALTGATCSNIGYLTFDTTINQSIVALYPQQKSRSLSRFYFYFLVSAKEKIRTYMTGGAQGGINQEDVRFLDIVSLPKEEQEEIVKFLDAKLNTIAKIIANIQTQITTLKELRKTLINDVVTGKIKIIQD